MRDGDGGSMSNKSLIAVASADIHLSYAPPLLRSLEEDWLEVQKEYLKQLKRVAAHGEKYILDVRLEVPLIVAGDLFDRFNATHEIVNLAIRELPSKVYSVAGNHDLPNHRLEDVRRSAYGVLKESGRISDLEPGTPTIIEGPVPVRLHGFPCGTSVEPLKDPSDLYLEIAVVHSYIWTKSTGYEGAPEEQRLAAYREKLKGYHIAIFGDNHRGFLYSPTEANACSVFNCGGFMIRKSDEKDYKPCVGLIYSDGSIEKHYLDISEDKYLDSQIMAAITETAFGNEFLEELIELGESALDFSCHLKRMVERKEVSPKVKKEILTALEAHEK